MRAALGRRAVAGAILLAVATVVGGCTKSPTPGGETTTTLRPALPFSASPSASDLADAAGLGFPDSISNYRSVRVAPAELDVTFQLPSADVAEFVDGSDLGDLSPERILTVHPSPLWDLDPGGTVQSSQSVHDGILRLVEIVTVPGQDLRTVRLVVTTQA